MKWMFCLLLLIFLLARPFSASRNGITCEVPSEVIFLLDGSESLMESDFTEMKKFVKKLLGKFCVRDDCARIGVIVFGTFPGDTITLGSYVNSADLDAEIDKLTQPISMLSGTGTSKAIQRMRDMFMTQGTPGVPKVGVVITDGRSKSPRNTQLQAKLAKNANISMVAIAIGNDVFRTELMAIASGSDQVHEGNIFDDLVVASEATLRKLICQAAAPTPMTVTLPTGLIAVHAVETFPPRAKTLEEVCPDCNIDIDWGYTGLPGDCTKYVNIFPVGDNGRQSVVMSCPFGMFWDTTTSSCQQAILVDCISDPCKDKLTDSIPYPDICSAYWMCFNGHAVAVCCSLGYRFKEGQGCISDPTCVAACPSANPVALLVDDDSVCNKAVHATDATKYVEDLSDGRNLVRDCAPGSAFNVSTCGCTDHIDHQFIPVQQKKCSAEIEFDFINEFKDSSGNNLPCGVEGVEVINNQATFDGKGLIRLWRFKNTDFRNALVISFRFFANNNNQEPIQALVSNCVSQNDADATITIMIVPRGPSIIFRTETLDGTAEINMEYNSQRFNDVIYIYDGAHLTAVVNGNAEKRELTGNIVRRQTGIIIGSGCQMGHFNGKLDNFMLAMCIPESVSQWL